MNEEDLRTRVRNPNKEFDSYFWRPRNIHVRRLLAKYITYIEVAAYVFAVILLGSIVYAWTVQHKEWTGFVGGKLMPASAHVKPPRPCALELSLVPDKSPVRKGDTVAFARAATGERFALLAPCSGILSFAQADSSGKPTLHIAADTATTLFSVLDFSAFSFDGVFSGGNADSVSIGDTAEIEIQKRFDADLLINVDAEDTGMAIRPFCSAPGRDNPFFDSLKAFYRGRDVTSRQQGVYRVTSADMPTLVLEFDVRGRGSDASADTEPSFTARRFYGAFSSGTRLVRVEIPKPFPDSVLKAIRRWTDTAFANRPLAIDGKAFAFDTARRILAKTIVVNAEAPLETYVPFAKRPRHMKEYDLREFKVSGTVRVERPPRYVTEMALRLFRARKEFLDVNVRINSYRVSWGKKLISRK